MILKYFFIIGKLNRLRRWFKVVWNLELEVGRKVWEIVVFKNW